MADPTIALGVRVPQIDSPLKGAMETIQLRNAIQQGQAHAQQLQSGALAIQAHQKALADSELVNQSYRDALSVDPEGKPSIDTNKLTKALALGGHGEAIPGILQGITKSQEATATLAKLKGEVKVQQDDAAGAAAAAIKRANYDPRLAVTLLAHHAQQFPDDAAHITPVLQGIQQILTDDPTGEKARQALPQLVDPLISRSQKFSALASQEETAKAKADAEARQAREEADVTAGRKATTVHTQAETDKLNRDAEMIRNTKPEDMMSLVDKVVDPSIKENSALNNRTKARVDFAMKRGDVKGAQEAISKAADEVRQLEVAIDPRVKANKIAISVGSENAKAAAGTPGLEHVTQKTYSGREYVDGSEFHGKAYDRVDKAAREAGIPVVNKDTAGMLSDLDTARQNQDYMLKTIGDKLASDPTGRLFTGPTNTIEKLIQTDPKLASIGTFRTAAIASMRAVAGSKGLRINKAEIEMAVDNDIPKLSDTLPVAKQKLANMAAFMDNVEKSHLVRDRSAANPASNSAPAATHRFNPATGKAEPIQ